MDAPAEFVVGIRAEEVSRSRRWVVRMLGLGAAVYLVVGAVVIGFSGVIVVVGGSGLGNAVTATMTSVTGILVLSQAVAQWRRRGRVRAIWANTATPPAAMRLSASGIRMSLDDAPDSVFLPWETVLRLRVHRFLRRSLLVVDLVPGVYAGTPGVAGLDHPDVLRVLSGPVHGTRGLRTAVQILDRPLAEIDSAAAHFTAGRVRVVGQ
ncbi:hypothetical protein JK358_31350 [Nocardia sp. 2]|uniref:Uncharacterized protein n=1 Tax=Nocardia acididurans TaxID=2802282 RepID=A0ABS1MFS0_9NOCA|nr:hypothetical protein [Nocardia acididurans]MBL1078910.1 hypothetical protein [Nocardia acididurans]